MTHDQVVNALEQDRANLLAALEGIPDDVLATRPAVGEWTVKDLLGHMAMWQRVAVQFIADYRATGAPKSLGLEDDAAVDAYNARGAASRRDWTLQQVRSDLNTTYAELLAAVRLLTDEDLVKPLPAPWHQATTLERLIAINSYTHDPEHVEQIRGLQGLKTSPPPDAG